MPEHSPYRVVVVGAGFGGIGMALALKQAGIEDFLIVRHRQRPWGHLAG
jgi:cation diffusion facilitator CzcD-associated flavoprotein CzcO